jgi:hypothetical protein
MSDAVRNLMALLIVAMIGVLAWNVLTMPDHRSTGQRVGDAIDALPNVGKASNELQDRTPGQRLGDSIKDVGQNVKDTTSN